MQFIGLLSVAFIVLKLTKIVNWAWFWVLCPIWVGIAVMIVILVIGIFIVGINSLSQKGGK